jgi:DNA-directed RNA polymerase specialized sigma24 family protein
MLDEGAAQRDPADVDILDLDAALSELASFDSRKSRLVELRFFGGLSLEESAQALGLSRATVERDWQLARLWIYRRITHQPDGHDA